uniref:Uncharacterized protein n=1 Tax=Mimivirus LCMiAC01 TaxID=2506608 RepID=A0A481Z1D6_9VIRU|nr:MAG: hypothetical protein LCMiAC01_01830 [Mimivirus LCMiAC01]
MSSIFYTQNDLDKNNDISGKITYTDVHQTIPKNCVTKPMENWKDQKLIECRWRFIKLYNRNIVEISYMRYDSDERLYFRYGEWHPIIYSSKYDKNVTEQYYFYSSI